MKSVQSETSAAYLSAFAYETIIAKAAPTNSTVLIQGESGTDKELVARAIHN